MSAGSMSYVQRIEDYYEQLWERLPDKLDPPDYELRRSFALDGVEPGDRVLDLGCGEGAFTQTLDDAASSVVGVDVARAALERARRRHPKLDFRLARIAEPLPFDDCVFDLVWASEVIEHVADTAAWLSELRRVLRPGGRLLLTTPNHPRAALLLHGIERFAEPLGDHLHLYTARALTTTLSEFGFEHVQIRRAGGPPLFRRMLLARAARR
jgi:ubiquinone/menaquinone biosynthesis C-methylase UbiE